MFNRKKSLGGITQALCHRGFMRVLVKSLMRGSYAEVLCGSCAGVLCACNTPAKVVQMCHCLSGLVRRPCATKTLTKIGEPCATKTLHKTFVEKKPYAGLGGVVGLLHEVLCEPCAVFC